MIDVKDLWWRVRLRMMPQRGITASWKNYKFILFLEDRSHCFGLWASEFRPLMEFDTLARAVVREGDCVIDVGANYGYTSTIFARACGSTGKVISIEAAPHTAKNLRRQIAAAGFGERVLIVNRAVGDREGLARMRASFKARQDCQYVISEGESIKDEREYLSEEIVVPIDTLDRIVESSGVKAPVLMKIDVEGFESSVLKGAKNILDARSPPWLLVEVLSPEKEMTSGGSSQILNQLVSYSGEYYIYEQGRFARPEREELILLSQKLPYFNLLVKPPRGEFRERWT
jgi:FkbM family methyltransferase